MCVCGGGVRCAVLRRMDVNECVEWGTQLPMFQVSGFALHITRNSLTWIRSRTLARLLSLVPCWSSWELRPPWGTQTEAQCVYGSSLLPEKQTVCFFSTASLTQKTILICERLKSIACFFFFPPIASFSNEHSSACSIHPLTENEVVLDHKWPSQHRLAWWRAFRSFAVVICLQTVGCWPEKAHHF